jgi:hypothetical protein
VARERSRLAIQSIADLPESELKDAMISLASYSVSREY